MNNWFKHKEKIQILQDRYIRLMRKSYELALKDKEKSDKAHEEACRIKNELNQIREGNLSF